MMHGRTSEAQARLRSEADLETETAARDQGCDGDAGEIMGKNRCIEDMLAFTHLWFALT